MREQGDSPPWAHSARPDGTWHRLDDHLESTAALAAEFARPFGGAEAARLAGLLHDVPKGRDSWQCALARAAGSGGPTGEDHKKHAARLAGRLPQPLSIVVGAAILGHHSGIPDLTSRTAGVDGIAGVLTDTSFDAGIEESLQRLGLTGDRVRRGIAAATLSDLPFAIDNTDESTRRAEFFTRMVHSALVDADFLDTDRHFRGADAPHLARAEDFEDLHRHFEDGRKRLIHDRRSSPIASLRENVYREAVERAALRPGIFRLPAPTGSGKTLTTMGFALRHAAIHGLRRVVVAVPFTSITTQNAAVYRELLDLPRRPRVLEHHSSILDEDARSAEWRRLAATNWDAPVIMTTTVQLFESLFANRPAKTRKLHRLAQSVIVLDEVQALPIPLVPAILDVLRTLVDEYGATVVLSTATEPAFFDLAAWQGVNAESLVPNETHVRSSLRRVTYVRRSTKAAWSTVADWVASERSALAIVNTTSDAQRLHSEVAERAPSGARVLHLSTRMCGAHRREALDEVRDLLVRDQPVLLIATQVIEAGVDVDFPVVFRAMAPCEALAQAGGRANREGRLAGGGRVVIFSPADGGLPQGDYATRTKATESRLPEGECDPGDRKLLRGYFTAVYATLDLGGPGTISAKIAEDRAKLAFRSVSDEFAMIDGNVCPVLVDHRDGSHHLDALLDRLCGPRSSFGDRSPLSSDDWTFLQSRTATITTRAATQAASRGSLRVVRPSIHPFDQSGIGPDSILRWTDPYDEVRGIELDRELVGKDVIW